MFHTLHKVETPGQSPGSGALQPAPGLPAPHGGGYAGEPQNAEPALGYRDVQALGPGSELPDSGAVTAPERPGTTARSPPRQDTAPQAPAPGGASGPAALSDRQGHSRARSASGRQHIRPGRTRCFRALRGPPGRALV